MLKAIDCTGAAGHAGDGAEAVAGTRENKP